MAYSIPGFIYILIYIYFLTDLVQREGTDTLEIALAHEQVRFYIYINIYILSG